MKRVAVGVVLLALAGCGQEEEALPAGPAPLTARVVAAEAIEHLGAAESAVGRSKAVRHPAWRADVVVLPTSRLRVEVVTGPAVRERFGTCDRRVRRTGVLDCQRREGYAVPVLVEAYADRRTFTWTAVALARRNLLREASLTITGPGDRDRWIEGEDLPGATLDQLIAIVLDPDLAPVTTAAAAQEAESLAGYTE